MFHPTTEMILDEWSDVVAHWGREDVSAGQVAKYFGDRVIPFRNAPDPRGTVKKTLRYLERQSYLKQVGYRRPGGSVYLLLKDLEG